MYPWDLVGDPAAGAAVAALGVDRVALAASYHSVRAATPRHPARRVVDAHSAALYVPVTDGAWAGHALVPRDAADWTGTENSFGAAAGSLRAAGLEVDAWTVLTHSTYLGRANPQLCVRNAFGEVYSYALCPSQPAVREYARTVTGQVLDIGEPDGLILEAVGALGFGHQSRHEKTDGADYGAPVQKLLSLCFCEACAQEYKGRGLEPESLSAHVRDTIRRFQCEPDATAGKLDTGEFRELLQCRWDAAAALLDAVLEQAHAYGITRMVVDTDPDPWATGPFLPAQAMEGVENRGSVGSVLQAWGSPADSIGKLDAHREAAPGAGASGAYVQTLPPRDASPAQWAHDWRLLTDAGYAELHVYHLGLASDRRRSALADALRTLRNA
jgi:hypothetical protein